MTEATINYNFISFLFPFKKHGNVGEFMIIFHSLIWCDVKQMIYVHFGISQCHAKFANCDENNIFYVLFSNGRFFVVAAGTLNYSRCESRWMKANRHHILQFGNRSIKFHWQTWVLSLLSISQTFPHTINHAKSLHLIHTFSGKKIIIYDYLVETQYPWLRQMREKKNDFPCSLPNRKLRPYTIK